MRTTRATRAAVLALAASVAAASVAAAADTWTNAAGTGLWSTGGNWADGSMPSPADQVTFPMPGPASHTLALPGPPTAGNATAQSLVFHDSYTLNGGTLAMPGAPITVGPAAVATINSRIASSTGLAKDGNGTLVLGGDNSTTLSGDIHINDGVLRYGSDANLGQTFARLYIHDTLEIDSTFTSMKRMEPSNGTIRVTAGNTFTLAANDQFGFSNADALYKDGPGTLVTTGHSSRFGPTYMLGGITRVAGGDFGYGPYVLGSDATLEVGAGMFGGGFVQNNTTLGVNSVLRGIANVQANNVFGQAGAAMNATLAATADALFQVNLQNNPGNSSSVFHIVGPGTVRLLNNALAYTGGWSIDSGTLRIASSQALGSGTSAISIGSGGGLQLDNTSISRALNLAHVSVLRANGNAAAIGFLNVAPNAHFYAATTAATDVLTLSGPATPADRINGGAGGLFRVLGPGRVVIANATQFAGGWSVDAGTLRIQHPNALGVGTAPVAVNDPTATFEIGGPMTVTRNIAFNDGTIRTTGGNVTLAGTVTVGAGSVVSFNAQNGSLTIGDGPNDITYGGNSGDSFINIGPNSGPVILTHANDVRSAWTIKPNASLHISDDAQLGPLVNSRPIKLDGVGAELRTLAPIATARDIVANAGVFNSNGFDSSYGEVTGSGGTLVKSGAGTLSVNHVRAQAMTVDGGAVRIKPNGAAAGVSTLDVVSVSESAHLDLTNNALVVTDMLIGTFDGAAYDGVTGLLAAAYDFSAWNGAGGIGTSETAAQEGLTGLAVAHVDQTVYAGGTFRGASVAAEDVLVMYTYAGDLNLDGLVDAADYGVIDNWIQFPGTFGYALGDINYDGVIDAADYGIIDNTIQLQGPPIATAAVLGDGVTMVPEPGAVAAGLAGVAALLRRVRRRSARRRAGY